MPLDQKHQCENEGCWCRREKPSTLGDVLLELSILKDRMSDMIFYLDRIGEKIDGIKKEKRKQTAKESAKHPDGRRPKSGRNKSIRQG